MDAVEASSTGGQDQQQSSSHSLLAAFTSEIDSQVERTNRELNQFIPMPDDPSYLTPEFRRVLRNAQSVYVVEDAPTPSFQRRDHFVTLPEAPKHPWIPSQPIGPNIVHGDGFQNIVGTGEVGFENSAEQPLLPEHYRGLRHTSIVGTRLPQRNGFTNQDVVIKHSFKVSGRGVFAEKKIPKGSILMVVGSTAQHTGHEGEINRLGTMVADLLKALAASCTDDDMNFLHNTVLTGQLSSIVERWPESATDRVIELAGGEEVLHKLQLHRLHVGRLAAVMDMNGILIESSFAERHGTGYWPEAGFFNHSCIPNVTYETVPQHMFTESEFYLDMLSDSERRKAQTAEEPVMAPSLSSPGLVRSSGSPTATLTLESVRADLEEKQRAWQATDLTAAGTPQMIFCMRADRDIEAGEELFMSYVPSNWSFEARQVALNHRYRFWCRCEKCAPSVDRSYAMLPKFSVAILVFMMLMQLLAHTSRSAQARSDEDILLDDQGNMPEGNDLGFSGAMRMPGSSFMEANERVRWDRAWNGEHASAQRRLQKEFYANDPYAKTNF